MVSLMPLSPSLMHATSFPPHAPPFNHQNKTFLHEQPQNLFPSNGAIQKPCYITKRTHNGVEQIRNHGH
jgi:hypothetical protein